MLKLLRKLDSAAGRLVDRIDDDLQQPVVRILTGDVFLDGQPTQPAPVEIEPAAPLHTIVAHPAPVRQEQRQPEYAACDLACEPVLS